MSFVNVVPDALATAGARLVDIGATVNQAGAAATSPTTAIAAPAADEVSQAITALFAAHAQEFQALSAKATAFHERFVSLLNGSAAQYASAEATAADTLFNFSLPLGPLEAFMRVTSDVLPNGVGVLSSDRGIRLNTPIGPVSLLEEAGTLYLYSDGSQTQSYRFVVWPFDFQQTGGALTIRLGGIRLFG